MGAKTKVLLVEDNYMNKVLVKEILTLHGYEVMEARSGVEALKLLGSERPDLILMDLHLPEMDGITATRIIKADETLSAIPVLALTASASRMEEEEVMSKGFDGCITKPVEMKKLVEAVSKVLHKA